MVVTIGSSERHGLVICGGESPVRFPVRQPNTKSVKALIPAMKCTNPIVECLHGPAVDDGAFGPPTSLVWATSDGMTPQTMTAS
jgi:hypothetical protein